MTTHLLHVGGTRRRCFAAAFGPSPVTAYTRALAIGAATEHVTLWKEGGRIDR
jgi:hypothetical protein